jgi:methylenetetrahydrofolate--tRNA-(uracil-5-)-methyltransferase
MANDRTIHVIGGGLAGSEAAWQAAESGCPVVVHEMRPAAMTDAHKTDGLAELVCSNSFRSDDDTANAVGLLHWEMRQAGSLVMSAADRHKLPAGGALAVDREGFSAEITARLEAHPLIAIDRREVDGLPPEDWHSVIIATGPLTSPALAGAIRELTGDAGLAFFDAIAPIVYRESIDFSVAWYQSRYDKTGPGGGAADYINCPMDRDQYYAFIDALKGADATDFKDWEANTPYFDGCLPIEVMAERGPETLRHGPMKPRGLTNEHKPQEKAYAVVQLRQDNALGTLYNMVGFQTKLKYGEQLRIFRTIPGLEKAEFARLGGLHRNTFLNSPRLLDAGLRLKACPAAALCRADDRRGRLCRERGHRARHGPHGRGRDERRPYTAPPPTTAHGALVNHITGGHIELTDAGQRLVPADERELRAVSPRRGPQGARRQAPARQGQAGGAQDRLHQPRQGRLHRLARRACGHRGGIATRE